jgi:Xaa-Pro dipeptidase
VVSQLLAAVPLSDSAAQVLYLEGEITRERHDTDTELPFRQESNFFYLTGCQVPGAKLVVSAESKGVPLGVAAAAGISDIKTTLFIPPVNPVEVM